jgi:hypothetical protein
MTVHVYQAHYFGGPYDGCAVIGTNQCGEDTCCLPVPIFSSDGRAGALSGEAYHAVYKLRRTRRLIDLQLGLPALRYEYEFVGYELAAASQQRPSWFARVAGFLRRAFHRSSWLPQPEGRPEGLGQGSALTCPGPGSSPAPPAAHDDEVDRSGQHVQRWSAALLGGVLVFVTSAAQSAIGAGPVSNCTWQSTDSQNCRIYQWQSKAIDAGLERRCEATLVQLSMYWFGESQPLDPKCDIVVHSTDESYCRAVGLHSRYTSASVLIGDQDQKPFYRIDVRGNHADWEAACLPHELTHALFAQRFAGGRLPKWIDEGTALLADPPSKQTRHLQDFYAARSTGTAFPLARLMSLADYPARRDWPTFYGQSLSLVKFLVERKSARAFVEFIHTSLQEGQEAALREVYGIYSVGDLDRIWSQYQVQPNAQFTHVSSMPRSNESSDIEAVR